MSEHETAGRLSVPVSQASNRKPEAARFYAEPGLRLGLGLRPVLLLGLLAVLGGMFLLNLTLGSIDIPTREVIEVLLGGEASKKSWTNIVYKWRLPKAITATLAGAALATSGLQMQTFFRNPLAGPFVLGISSGASLGVALIVLSSGTAATGTMLASIALGSSLSIAAAASLGAGIVMGVVLLVAQRVESTMTLLVLGLMIGYLTSSLVSLLLYFSIAEQIQAYINWTFGSFASVSWQEMEIFAPAIAGGMMLALAISKPLNALLLGETYARSMGLNVNRTRLAIIASTAILAGTVTAFCGPIAFIGIAVPHLSRMLFGTSDHRLLIPATAILGGIVALTALLIAGMPGSGLVLPLNAVTALIGAPVVMWVVLRRGNLHKGLAR
ncbi:MAG: iron ABC transporter permease [Chloroflexi bacterium]|nr:iron ABC transporter permease [Chloroflexota bacterium]